MFDICLAIAVIDNEKEKDIIERLYSEYKGKVKGMAMKILRNDMDAEDAVGETFLKIIKYRTKFVDIGKKEQERWLVIITNSVCYNMLKKKNRTDSMYTDITHQNEEEDEYVKDIPDDLDILQMFITKEAVNQLSKAIHSLDYPAKEIVIMKYYYDMKNIMIAEILEMNASTVSTILERSMKKLRKILEEFNPNGT